MLVVTAATDELAATGSGQSSTARSAATLPNGASEYKVCRVRPGLGVSVNPREGKGPCTDRITFNK